VAKKKPYVCPVRNLCPNYYDACTDPTKFCRVIEDTPEHFSQIKMEKRDKIQPKSMVEGEQK